MKPRKKLYETNNQTNNTHSSARMVALLSGLPGSGLLLLLPCLSCEIRRAVPKSASFTAHCSDTSRFPLFFLGGE